MYATRLKKCRQIIFFSVLSDFDRMVDAEESPVDPEAADRKSGGLDKISVNKTIVRDEILDLLSF